MLRSIGEGAHDGGRNNGRQTCRRSAALIKLCPHHEQWNHDDSAADTKAFMDGVKWLPLLGLLPLGLLVFSLTPYGKVMALSKEGRVLLIGASLFLFVAPAISKALVDNAMVLIILTAAGVAGYFLWERKTAYKIDAAKRGAI
jgi:hypothetical protein